MLLTTLLLFTLAAPLNAQVVDISLQRISGEHAQSYNKIDVEFTSAQGESLRLCPEQASVSTARLAGGRYRSVDRYTAHAMQAPGSGFTSQCRDLVLSPGRPQRVTFYVRGVPGRWRGEDLYSFSVEAGTRQFEFVQTATAAR